MTFLVLVALLVLAAVAALIIYSHVMARRIEARYPPGGAFFDVGGYKLHAVHIPAGASADLPPIVFLHGASGNLRDQAAAFRQPLEGRAELFFIDRPGHGYSERGGPENGFPDGQARAIAKAMEKVGISRAIISAHSFGAAVAASFALQFPEKTIGLVFLAPATHPWPGGVAWYYDVARNPVLGRLFAHAVALPAGKGRVEAVTHSVFAPNRRPDDYVEKTGPALVLRPEAFRANAIDIANLHGYVTRMAPRYGEIAVPTVIITGNRDRVVLPRIHSKGLASAIAGARLVEIDNLGHKPDYVVTDLAIAAIEMVAGRSQDLTALARAAERRIAGDGKPSMAAGKDQMPEAPSEPI